ncbi:MAG: 2-hydroxyacyl-CoA dehydratase [Candidatus Abyssobacteria bacterium SURF_17]|uniref:2-hydroxyacyl-CoA dehydratase n=1 Tax=Candidatus Abyssobacteria bacterium SURF_17 TaxID=2093361 RepID=A0A419EUP8_9BACT|nr:MAG: 2-hydroxyacyl-CoA dehydratase [Candidatus Abyssubacteria bacterium SURF_17]
MDTGEDTNMSALETLAEVSATRLNSFVSKWKSQGKKVVGYVCTYLPEEILYAADILPYRITGKGAADTSLADSYLTRVNCTFSRCCLELAFSGQYDFLDGATFVNGCDHIRRAFDNWRSHQKALPFMYILPVPHLLSPEALVWYKEEVVKFKEAIEGHFGTTVDPQKLKEAVSTYNESRKLLRRLYDLQAGTEPPLKGSEVITVLSAGTAMPKGEFNTLLRKLLEEAGTRKRVPDKKTRLLVAGSVLDDAEFIENVEGLGALVVTDALCFGTRSFWDLTDETGDAFDALVNRYFNHVPCPRMAGEYPRRMAFLKEQAARAHVDGAILEHIKFCDLHGTDNALLKRDLEKAGIATLELERQYGPLADAGRLRTRIQAFLERIRR